MSMISDKRGWMKFKNLRLRTKLVITYMMLTVIPMALIGLFIYYQNTKSIQEEVGEYIPRLLNQANQNIESEINDLESLPNLIYNASDVIGVLRSNPYKEQSELLEDRFTVENFLSNTYLGQHDTSILGAFLLSKNRAYVSAKVPYEGFELNNQTLPYGEAHEFGDSMEVFLPDQIDLQFEGNPPYLLLVKELQDLDNRDSLGTLILAVRVTFIENILKTLDEQENASMWVMDESGQIIYHTTHEKIGTSFEEIQEYPILNGSFRTVVNGEETLISTNQSEQHGWVTVHSIPLKFLTERTDVVKNWTLAIFVILVFMTTLISIYLAGSVTKPINLLSRLMKKVEKGELEVDIPIQTKDEVGELADSFQSMIDEIRELIRKNYQVELRQKNAELYALQSQINPHFMYNTLETIGAAIEEEDKEVVVDMIAILGRMLRFSLSNKDKLVMISEEVRHVQNFLTLQQFRFEDRISFEITNEVEHQSLFTPKFILQPVVENAVKYGMERRQALSVSVDVTRQIIESGEQQVIFTVRDNGPGMKQEELNKVKKKLQADPMMKRDSGFGLINVHSRLEMMFGSGYGLSIFSKEGEGTEVTIRIPEINKDQARKLTFLEERGDKHDKD
ncbi:cache domain-containing sensor histidine kinase [Sediminibacillus massiliensis]|uniref:cache domain-containing sensor histidine kinase n=1 Tax=Sediminibacillus massiliensis TaxID=1926277 RepID=UPI0009883DB0|nr:sensor histidine kinase [Sediminibacillus massiliensis]